MMGVPGCPGREWLGFVVVTERGQMVPGWIMTGDLDQSRCDHETEEQPAQKPKPNWRRSRIAGEARPYPPGSNEQSQKSGLEQQSVPLEPQEVPAHRGQG